MRKSGFDGAQWGLQVRHKTPTRDISYEEMLQSRLARSPDGLSRYSTRGVAAPPRLSIVLMPRLRWRPSSSVYSQFFFLLFLLKTLPEPQFTRPYPLLIEEKASELVELVLYEVRYISSHCQGQQSFQLTSCKETSDIGSAPMKND
jgi:hypothetical protein